MSNSYSFSHVGYAVLSHIPSKHTLSAAVAAVEFQPEQVRAKSVILLHDGETPFLALEEKLAKGRTTNFQPAQSSLNVLLKYEPSLE